MVNNSFFIFPISGELASLDLQFVWLGHHNTMVDPKPAANNNIISPIQILGSRMPRRRSTPAPPGCVWTRRFNL